MLGCWLMPVASENEFPPRVRVRHIPWKAEYFFPHAGFTFLFI